MQSNSIFYLNLISKKISDIDSIKIARELKKKLVEDNILEVSQQEMERILFYFIVFIKKLYF